MRRIVFMLMTGLMLAPFPAVCECYTEAHHEWERVLTHSVRAHAIARTKDGGALLAGEAIFSLWGIGFSSYSRSDICLVRVDARGKKLWDRAFSGKGDELANAIALTEDDGALLAGYTNSMGAGKRDMYLVRVDAKGRKLWGRTYGGKGDDIAHAIVMEKDGGALLAGYTNSMGAGKRDMYLLRVDAKGRKLWDRTYGGKGDDIAQAIVLTKDGGALLAGYTNSMGAGKDDMYLVRVDAKGKKLWERTYGGKGDDRANAIALTKSGEAMLAGWTYFNRADGYLVRVDARGNKLWEWAYKGSGQDGLFVF